MSTLWSHTAACGWRIFICLAVVLSLSPLQWQPVSAAENLEIIELVKDIRPGAEGSAIDNVTICGSLVYFSADDGVHGVELWVSDGTHDGTYLVEDITIGVDSTTFAYLKCIKDRLFFFGTDPLHGRQLWTSDGSPQGTHIVALLGAAPAGIDPYLEPMIANTRLIFAIKVQNGTQVDEDLWSTDGTYAGTVLLYRKPADSLHSLEGLYQGQRLAYFTIQDQDRQYLGITDGTPQGTEPLVDPFIIYIPDSAHPEFFKPDFFTMGDVLFYEKNGHLMRMNLIDRVETVLHNFHYAGLFEFTPAAGTTFYFVMVPDIYTGSAELWKSDGTPGGTQSVFQPTVYMQGINSLIWIDPYFYFVRTGPKIIPSIMRTDGTGQGTIGLLGNIFGWYPDRYAAVGILGAWGNKIAVRTQGEGWNGSTSKGGSLWTTGPSRESAVEIKDVGGGIWSGTLYHNLLYMIVWSSYNPVTTETSFRLWRSDGSTDGTNVLLDGMMVVGYNNTTYRFLGTLNNRLLFVGSDGSSGPELWSLRIDLPESTYLPILRR
jgi:ELWxxDGT repeat protein